MNVILIGCGAVVAVKQNVDTMKEIKAQLNMQTLSSTYVVKAARRQALR